jgi:hypothetical protein
MSGSVYWEDLVDDLNDPEFLREYVLESSGPFRQSVERILAAVERIIAERLAAEREAMIQVARRQTDLTELVHFDKPSDFRKGVLTVIVALEAHARGGES